MDALQYSDVRPRVIINIGQARAVARNIIPIISEYIKDNRVEYEKWLLEQEVDAYSYILTEDDYTLN